MKAMLQSPTPANVLHAPDLFNITRYLNISKANPFARNAFTAFDGNLLFKSQLKCPCCSPLLTPPSPLLVLLIPTAVGIDLIGCAYGALLGLLSVAVCILGL